ncbi:MAG: beta-ketoacyl synthase N-terminal-like domain-containing protein [Proteobacteria bacterium]|nr:beta-ketoacyl synthase N-terminal-like domain-containing protein [Pseudomonadota bacterium]
MASQVFVLDVASISSCGDSVKQAYDYMLDPSKSPNQLPEKSKAVYGLSAAIYKKMWQLSVDVSLSGSDPTARLLRLVSEQLSLHDMSTEAKQRCGVVVGSSRGATDLLEDAMAMFYGGSLSASLLSSRTSPYTTASFLSSMLAQHYGLCGGHYYVSSACSSSLHALGMAYLMVKEGMLSHCLAGGVEWASTPFCEAILKKAGVLARSDGRFPVLKSFGSQRNGTVLGEGGGLALLSSSSLKTHEEKKEENERDKKRDKNSAVMEICGFGMASESFGMVGLSEDGEALRLAFQRATAQSCLSVEDIDMVVVHGSGTSRGDGAEIQALMKIFRKVTCKPHLLITKWATGHTLGASGILALSLAFQECKDKRAPWPLYPVDSYIADWRRIPVTHNRENKWCSVLGKKKSYNNSHTCRYGCVLGMGFGGSAAVLVFRNLLAGLDDGD